MTTNPQRDVRVDKEEIDKVVSQMETLIEEIVEAKASVADVVDKMVEEASANTGSGQPAPVYGPILNAANVAGARIVMSLDAIVDRLRNDILTLQGATNAAGEITEEMAGVLNKMDTAVGLPAGGTVTSSGTGVAGVQDGLSDNVFTRDPQASSPINPDAAGAASRPSVSGDRPNVSGERHTGSDAFPSASQAARPGWADVVEEKNNTTGKPGWADVVEGKNSSSASTGVTKEDYSESLRRSTEEIGGRG